MGTEKHLKQLRREEILWIDQLIPMWLLVVRLEYDTMTSQKYCPTSQNPTKKCLNLSNLLAHFYVMKYLKVIQKIYINSCLQELLSPIIKIINTPYLYKLHLDLPRRSVIKGESPPKLVPSPQICIWAWHSILTIA